MTKTVSKEYTTEEHRRLVKVLIDKFVKDGLSIVTADYEGYLKPRKQGRHEPDVVAEAPNGLLVIGEAKLCDRLTTTKTMEQLNDFSTRQAKDGPLKGTPIPFHIITPMGCNEQLHLVLKGLGLENRDNVHIWMSS
jgi:hypothetical protein